MAHAHPSSHDDAKGGPVIKPIMKDRFVLRQTSVPASADDLQTARDLRDTLAAHADSCVGMAANMIGVLKRIIVFDDNGATRTMLNPEIVEASGPFEAEEGCLSLDGVRTTTRYRTIKVRFQDEQLREHTKSYRGWTAQIIQHEVDHCNGILI